MGILDPLYGILDLVLKPVFNLAGENEKVALMIGIFFVSILISLITTVATVKVIDQEEMKINKKQLKESQEKIKKARDKGDEKKVKKLTSEMMEVQSEVMKGSFKPMMYTFPPIIVVFQWLRQYEPLQTFILQNNDVLVSLPFVMPKLPKIHSGGPQLGWLGWYIFCSFMTSTIIRKIFKVQT